MNLVKTDTIREALEKAAKTTLPSTQENSLAWTIDLEVVPSEGHPHQIYGIGEFGDIALGQSASRAIERCRAAVHAGKGYSSEVLECSTDGTAAICITIIKDCIVTYRVYVAVHCSDVLQENIETAQLLVPHVDQCVSSFGPRWSIGGSIPENYRL